MRWVGFLACSLCFACRPSSAPPPPVRGGAQVCGELATEQPVHAPFIAPIFGAANVDGRAVIVTDRMLYGTPVQSTAEVDPIAQLQRASEIESVATVSDGFYLLQLDSPLTHYSIHPDNSVTVKYCAGPGESVSSLVAGDGALVAVTRDGLYTTSESCDAWTKVLDGGDFSVSFSPNTKSWLAFNAGAGTLFAATKANGSWSQVADGLRGTSAHQSSSPTSAVFASGEFLREVNWSSGIAKFRDVRSDLGPVSFITHKSGGGYWVIGWQICELDDAFEVIARVPPAAGEGEPREIVDLADAGTWVVGSRGLKIDDGTLWAPSTQLLPYVFPTLSCDGVESWSRYDETDTSWNLAAIYRPGSSGWRSGAVPDGVTPFFTDGPYRSGTSSIYWGTGPSLNLVAVAQTDDGAVQTLLERPWPHASGWITYPLVSSMTIPATADSPLRWVFELGGDDVSGARSVQLFLLDGSTLTPVPSPPGRTARRGLVDPVRPEHLAYFTLGDDATLDLMESFDDGRTWTVTHQGIVDSPSNIAIDSTGTIVWWNSDSHLCSALGCSDELVHGVGTVLDSSGNTQLLVSTLTQIETRTSIDATPVVISTNGFVMGGWLNLVMVSENGRGRLIRL